MIFKYSKQRLSYALYASFALAMLSMNLNTSHGAIPWYILTCDEEVCNQEGSLGNFDTRIDRFEERHSAVCKSPYSICRVFTTRRFSQDTNVLALQAWISDATINLYSVNALSYWDPTTNEFSAANESWSDNSAWHTLYGLQGSWQSPVVYEPATPLVRFGMQRTSGPIIFQDGLEIWTNCSDRVPAPSHAGDFAENFRLMNQTGGTTELCSYLGKPILLYIFDAWCEECFGEYVRLATEFWPDNRNAGFQPIVVVNDPTGMGWPDNVSVLEILSRIDAGGAQDTLPVLADINGSQHEQYESRSQATMHHMVIIDQNMKVDYIQPCTTIECQFYRVLDLLD